MVACRKLRIFTKVDNFYCVFTFEMFFADFLQISKGSSRVWGLPSNIQSQFPNFRVSCFLVLLYRSFNILPHSRFFLLVVFFAHTTHFFSIFSNCFFSSFFLINQLFDFFFFCCKFCLQSSNLSIR